MLVRPSFKAALVTFFRSFLWLQAQHKHLEKKNSAFKDTQAGFDRGEGTTGSDDKEAPLGLSLGLQAPVQTGTTSVSASNNIIYRSYQ